MQEVTDWLKKLGMSEYAQRFAENRIDGSVLPELTDQHLKDLGIALGDRLKILRAIRELGVVAPFAGQPGLAALKPEDTAERRQVTVMFCDLVGSTALSASMDPEDLRQVIAAYQKLVTEAVHRFDGFVAKYMGDGVLIYFGYPRAHEHDAERAVRVGLDIVATVGGLQTSAPQPLKVRIGIATGLVVVGDLFGSGEARERGIVGETPNLAARLQALAEPDAIVIADSTRRLVGDLFEYRDLGLVELKGLPQPVRALRVTGQSTVESRFEALHTSALTALVGREEETDLVLRRWRRAVEREGQAVLISGEPGIGKSRLAAAVVERIGAEPCTRVRYVCSPHHTDSAFHPIIQRLERAAGFAPHDDAPAKLEKLDRMLAQTSTSAEDRAIFASLLSLPCDGRYPRLDLSPQERRKRSIDAMTRRLEAMSREKPVLAIFEDVHWIDPTSLDVLGRIIDRIRGLPALLLVTFRPEFQPPWVGQPHVTVLALNRLAPPATADLIQRIIGNKALPEDVVREIVSRTDGVPLFVEELTNAAIEAETAQTAREAVATVPPAAQPIPATLHASLMARLDRLGPASDVARIAAAIGREFSYELLAAVANITENDLTTALDRLISAGLLFREGTPPHATYLFKHALIRDAAYGMLLRQSRRILHSRIGQKLEDIFPDAAETQPELLAHHFTEGEVPDKAIEYWLKAGRQAVVRATMTEALSHLAKGFALLSSTPDNTWRRQIELTLQIARASALIAMLGAAKPVVGEAYERARQLWEIAGRPSHFEPMLPLFWHHFNRGELGTAHQIASELAVTGEARNDPVLRFIGTSYLAATCGDRAEFAECRVHSENCLRIYDPIPVSKRLLYNGRATTLIVLSRALYCLGYPDQSRAKMNEGLLEVREVSNPYALAAVLVNALHVEWEFEPVQTILKHADELIALRFDSAPHGTIFRGWCLSKLGQAQQGMAVLTDTLSQFRAEGLLHFMPFYLMLLADVLEGTGNSAAALERLEEALHLVELTKEKWYEAQLHRTKGELLKSRGSFEAAEADFVQALSVARCQNAKMWELRSAASLARFWRDQGKRDEARDLLAPVYGWFTEGFDTLDLKEAKALLDEVSS